MALRLLRLVNRTVNGRTYRRWRIGDLPTPIVELLGWEEGAELEASVTSKGDLVLRRKRD